MRADNQTLGIIRWTATTCLFKPFYACLFSLLHRVDDDTSITLWQVYISIHKCIFTLSNMYICNGTLQKPILQKILNTTGYFPSKNISRMKEVSPKTYNIHSLRIWGSSNRSMYTLVTSQNRFRSSHFPLTQQDLCQWGILENYRGKEYWIYIIMGVYYCTGTDFYHALPTLHT